MSQNAILFKSAKENLEKQLDKLGLTEVWQKIEIPLIEVVEKIDSNGFLIDEKKLDSTSKRFHKEIEKLESKIHELAGEVFNIKSTQQLSKILFEKMEIPTKGLKKTPRGVISTKESELQKLIGLHPIVEEILQYREFTKLVSTYIDNIKPLISDDGRLRAKFLQTGTSTGRMSSKDPNLQNIPVRTESGREIRNFFICPKDFSLVSFDYSQIELRIAALMSQDKKLMKVFSEGGDIHTEVALSIFGSTDAEERRKAKIINFGILYGMGATALRKNLNDGNSDEEVTLKDARKYSLSFKLLEKLSYSYIECLISFSINWAFAKSSG